MGLIEVQVFNIMCVTAYTASLCTQIFYEYIHISILPRRCYIHRIGSSTRNSKWIIITLNMTVCQVSSKDILLSFHSLKLVGCYENICKIFVKVPSSNRPIPLPHPPLTVASLTIVSKGTPAPSYSPTGAKTWGRVVKRIVQWNKEL